MFLQITEALWSLCTPHFQGLRQARAICQIDGKAAEWGWGTLHWSSVFVFPVSHFGCHAAAAPLWSTAQNHLKDRLPQTPADRTEQRPSVIAPTYGGQPLNETITAVLSHKLLPPLTVLPLNFYAQSKPLISVPHKVCDFRFIPQQLLHDFIQIQMEKNHNWNESVTQWMQEDEGLSHREMLWHFSEELDIISMWLSVVWSATRKSFPLAPKTTKKC